MAMIRGRFRASRNTAPRAASGRGTRATCENPGVNSPATREQWSSAAGFVLAALGSAVGIGNVWRFSYVAGENGGGAFVLVYLLLVALIGLPLLLAELSIGRAAQREPIGALAALAGSAKWRFGGLPSVLAALVILAYYAVIAGWTMKYFAGFAAAATGGHAPVTAALYFESFIASPEPLAWQAAIMIATVAIVWFGVGGGIEAAASVMMPLLALILVALAVHGLSLPGAGAGLSFIFRPDWSALANPSVYLAALGQAFFSLGLAMGAMITYGSYVPTSRTLPVPALWIVAGDSLFALIAGLMIFPAVFSFGLDPASGPALAFITMPQVFGQMPGGMAIGAAFFGLLVVAAVGSTVSLLEVVVSFLIERARMRRRPAAVMAGALIFALGVPAALSFGWLGGIRIAGRNILDAMDNFASNLLLPANGILIAVFVGWVWSARDACNASGLGSRLAAGWHVVIRYVAPLLVGVVLLGSIGLIRSA